MLGLLAGELRPEMVEAVRRCHERLKTALLTNNFVPATADGAGRAAGAMAEVLDHLRRRSSSRARSGCASPTPRSTSWRATSSGVEPDEAVFLDDLGVNLKPARALGMTTIKVVDPDVALAELEAVVGFPLR